jgi:hypothetical protein
VTSLQRYKASNYLSETSNFHKIFVSFIGKLESIETASELDRSDVIKRKIILKIRDMNNFNVISLYGDTSFISKPSMI